MSTAMIQGAALLVLYILWVPLALAGWALPLTDGARRFTLRYLAWGTFGLIQWVALTPWDWWSILNVAVGVWAILRVEYWWKNAEIARRAGVR